MSTYHHVSSCHCSIEYWAILKIQRHKKKEQVQTLDIRSHHNQRIWKPPACQGRAVPPAGLNCPGSARCHRSTALTVDALDNHGTMRCQNVHCPGRPRPAKTCRPSYVLKLFSRKDWEAPGISTKEGGHSFGLTTWPSLWTWDFESIFMDDL